MAHAPSDVKPRRGITLTQQIFLGLAIGIIVGWIVSEYNPAAAVWFRPFSQLFLRLIKMIIAPLIFATLVAGIAGAGHVRRDRGVPTYLATREPRSRVVSVAFREVQDSRLTPRAHAAPFDDDLPFDYVWFTPRVDDEDGTESGHQTPPAKACPAP